MELERTDSNSSPVASTTTTTTTPTPTTFEHRQLAARKSRTPPPLKLPNLALLQNSKMIVVDKNHDLASQVIVGPSTPTSDASDSKHKRRRRSKVREDDVHHHHHHHHHHVKPESREIGIQVEIAPVPKKSPGRFLSFGKRTDSSNGIRRVSVDLELSDNTKSAKKTESSTGDVSKKSIKKTDSGTINVSKKSAKKTETSTPDVSNKTTKMAESPTVDVSNKSSKMTESPTVDVSKIEIPPEQLPETQIEISDHESLKNRPSKKSLKNREKNIFNKVRKMSQFISALKNSSASKRRKAEEALAASVLLQTTHNGQCCMHSDAAAKAKIDSSTFSNVTFEQKLANVTFEERHVKDNTSLGLPAMTVKFSKVYCVDHSVLLSHSLDTIR
jgi:hypothetical protein